MGGFPTSGGTGIGNGERGNDTYHTTGPRGVGLREINTEGCGGVAGGMRLRL